MSVIIIPAIAFIAGGAAAWKLSNLILRRRLRRQAAQARVNDSDQYSNRWDITDFDTPE